jgi:hypothetical protein
MKSLPMKRKNKINESNELRNFIEGLLEHASSGYSVRQTEFNAAKPLGTELSAVEFQTAIEKLHAVNRQP